MPSADPTDTAPNADQGRVTTTAARRAALYCVEKPYYGRDQQLAQGWLVVLDAIDKGRDPKAALNEFAEAFVTNSNNGVPRTVLDGD